MILKERLRRIDGAKSLIISTLDGIELMDGTEYISLHIASITSASFLAFNE